MKRAVIEKNQARLHLKQGQILLHVGLNLCYVSELWGDARKRAQNVRAMQEIGWHKQENEAYKN